MSYRLELGLALLLAGAIGVAVFAAHRAAQPPERGFRASTVLRGPGRRPAPVRGLGGEALRLPKAARVLAPRTPRGSLEGLVKRRVTPLDEGCETLLAKAGDTVVAARNGRPIVLRLHYAGGGTVTLASDVGWFRNQVW